MVDNRKKQVQASGSIKSEENAKNKNTSAPTSVTVLTEMRCAMNRPPSTANPVHKPCPIVPPSTVPTIFSRAAKIIVLICERSPHSARKVKMNACKNTVEMYFRKIIAYRLVTKKKDLVFFDSS